uniref:Peptidase A1 domain-containing protein n=1 Tax=Oryza punctata TaxID=4537 RepID=A0A0E0MM38_ORYPU
MGRRLTLSAMLVVAASSLISLQLLQPPPVVTSAAHLSPKLSSFVVVARPWVLRVVTSFLKALLQQEAYDVIQNKPSGGDGRQLGGAAVTGTAALLVINMSIGTPTPQNVSGLVHISSQLVWARCSALHTAPAVADAFRPNKSATFSLLPSASEMCPSVLRPETCGDGNNTTGAHCDGYVSTYGTVANTSGNLATDTFTFGSTSVPGVVFGCSDATRGDFSGASGVIGLGRGPLSLISQLQLSRFSYQLWAIPMTPTPRRSPSRPSTAASSDKASRSTPLLSSTMHPNLYYVNLTGIHVDGKRLNDIPAGVFDLKTNGSGGVVLSTTIPVTYLEAAAYRVVRKVVASRINLQPVDGSALGLDLCYSAASMVQVKVPPLKLVFDGAGAEMQLAVANYFLKDDDTGLECLTMLPSMGVSVLGSLLQAGINRSTTSPASS